MLTLQDIRKAVGLGERFPDLAYVEVGINPDQLPIAITLFVDGLGLDQVGLPTRPQSGGGQTCLVEFLNGARLALVEKQTEPRYGAWSYLFIETKDPRGTAAAVVDWAKQLGDRGADVRELEGGRWQVELPRMLCSYLVFVPAEGESS